MGHHSFRSLRGYGNLYADNTDAAGTVHGPSVQSSDMGTVFLRHVMKKGVLTGQRLIWGIAPHGCVSGLVVEGCRFGSAYPFLLFFPRE
jgi:hypothetical protein